MKYCEKCGKEIHDEAVVCPSCGCSTQAKPAPAPAPVANDMAENPKTARFALGFAFLCPIVGLIFGIKGIKQYASNKKLKTQWDDLLLFVQNAARLYLRVRCSAPAAEAR